MVFTEEAFEAWRDLDEERMRKYLDIYSYEPDTCCALFAAFHLSCKDFDRGFAAGKITTRMMLEECCGIHKKTFLQHACIWGEKGDQKLAVRALVALCSSSSFDASHFVIPNVGTLMHLAATVELVDFAKTALAHLPHSLVITPVFEKRTALAAAMTNGSTEIVKIFTSAVDATIVRDYGITETIIDLQHAYTFEEASGIVMRALHT